MGKFAAIAEDGSRGLHHLVNVNVRLVEAVEQHHGVSPIGLQLVDEGHGIGEVVAQLHDDGDGDGALHVAQNVDVALLEAAVSVLGIGLQGQDVYLQGIGPGGFYLSGKVNPVVVAVAVDAGDDGDGACLLAFLDEVEILVQLVLADVGGQVFAAFGIHVQVALVVYLHHDLLLEERLEHDGACARFVQLAVLGGVVGEARAADDDGVA